MVAPSSDAGDSAGGEAAKSVRFEPFVILDLKYLQDIIHRPFSFSVCRRLYLQAAQKDSEIGARRSASGA